MKTFLIIAWGVAQLAALLSGNFLIFVVMLLVDAVWLVAANLGRIADQQRRTASVVSSPSVASIQPTAVPSRDDKPQNPSSGPLEWWEVESEMSDALEVEVWEDGGGLGSSSGTVDFQRMEYSFSSSYDSASGWTNHLIRRIESGNWEFKELWSCDSTDYGSRRSLRTPIDSLNEEFKVGTPEWDAELEPQYRRRLAKAQGWNAFPEDMSKTIEAKYQAMLSFFRTHLGLRPGMSEEEFSTLKAGASAWEPPVHPEDATLERFVLECIEGPDKRSSFPIRNPGLSLVGKADDCAWRLRDSSALAHQFQIKLVDSEVTIRDLGGGIAINGEKLGEHNLAEGDQISFAATKLKVIECRTTPSEPRRSTQPKEKSKYQLWAESHPEDVQALQELGRREMAETQPLRAAHKERLRPLVEQKERSLTAARAAHDDMVRPHRAEYDRAVTPLQKAYGKADSDLAEQAARPFADQYRRATESARKLLREAEEAAEATYKAQVKPLDDALATALKPISDNYAEKRRVLQASFGGKP